MKIRKLKKQEPTNSDRVLGHAVVEGLLNPVEWDRDGRPVKYAVFCDNEEDYIIENYPKIKKLKRLANKRVRALGKPSQNIYGEKILYAARIKEVKRRLSAPPHAPVEAYLEEYPAHIPKMDSLEALKLYGEAG